MPSIREWFRRKKAARTPPTTERSQNLYSHLHPPLPRARALTLPLPSPLPHVLAASKQSTSCQSQSAFMRLPSELRLLVYEAAFGHRTFHVAFEFEPRQHGGKGQPQEWRWLHCASRQDEEAGPWWQHSCHYEGDKYGDVGMSSGKKKLNIALLLTCRKVYSEGIEVLYATNTFFYPNPSLYRDLPQLIPPQRYSSITSIELLWVNQLKNNTAIFSPSSKTSYNTLWIAFAAMPKLRRLRVAIYVFPCPEPVPEGLQDEWLLPLDRLRGRVMDVFEVVFPYTYAQNFHVDKETAAYTLSEMPDFDTNTILPIQCFSS